jgi:hypothetical protein
MLILSQTIPASEPLQLVPGFCRMAKAHANQSPERVCVNFSRTQDPFNFTER